MLSSKDFRKALEGAVAGKHADLEIILKLYAPLIDKYAMWKGQVDEDLRQYLLMRIALNISKFQL